MSQKKYEIYKDEQKVKPHNPAEKSDYQWTLLNCQNNTESHYATYEEAVEAMNAWEDEPSFLQ